MVFRRNMRIAIYLDRPSLLSGCCFWIRWRCRIARWLYSFLSKTDTVSFGFFFLTWLQILIGLVEKIWYLCGIARIECPISLIATNRLGGITLKAWAVSGNCLSIMSWLSACLRNGGIEEIEARYCLGIADDDISGAVYHIIVPWIWGKVPMIWL